MQRSYDPGVLPLQTIELGNRITGLRQPDRNPGLTQGCQCFLRYLHPTKVAGTDHQHVGFLRQDSLKIVPIEAMPFLAVPVLLNMLGKNDQIRLEILTVDRDLAEFIVVDMHISHFSR